MRLRTRLMFLIGAAALVPLGIVGVGATQLSVDQMTRSVADTQARAADELSSLTDLWLSMQLEMLTQPVRSFRVERLSDEKLEGFQRLVLQHSRNVNIVSLVNADGADLAPSLYLTEPGQGTLAGKEAVSPARFAAYRAALPLARIRASRAGWAKGEGIDAGQLPVVVGRPYTPPGRDAPVVPVIVPASPAADVLLAAEVALDEVAERFRRVSAGGMQAALLDAAGTPVIGADMPLIDAERFRVFSQGAACSEVRYKAANGTEVLGACSPVLGTGWMVVVANESQVITAAAEGIQRRTGFIALVALALSVVMGLAFSRQLAAQVTRVKDAALSVAEGNLGLRVSLDGPLEVRDLSRAFNFMSTRLERNRSEIEAKQVEIDAFNQKLRLRLSEQEEELTEANRRLLQSARLAAVGEMGAGLAHELNNPLAGILGMVQLLRAKAEDGGESLKDIEEQAQRCREIVGHLLRFSRDGGDARPLDPSEWSVVDLGKLLGEVAMLVSGPFRSAGVDLEVEASEPISVRCDKEAIGQAMVQLLTSVRAACDQGGRVSIALARVDAGARVDVRASGLKVGVGADDWNAHGMGVWLARQVIADHDGHFEELTPDPGGSESAWALTLPEA